MTAAANNTTNDMSSSSTSFTRRRLQWQQQQQQWKYRICGPTTAHLRYEFYLLCSLLLLTCGSLRGLYKESFLGGATIQGDALYLLLSAAVAGRHLLVRLLCTWDPSTHAAPTLTGLLSHFLQSHCTGGQTFDRPPPLQQLWMHPAAAGAASSGSGGSATNAAAADSSSGSASAALLVPTAAAERLVQITAISDSGTSHKHHQHHQSGANQTTASLVDLCPSTLIYAWQMVRVYVWFPLSRLWASSNFFWHNHGNPKTSSGTGYSSNSNNKRRSSSNRDSAVAVAARPKSALRRTLEALQQYAVQLWVSYGPSLQFSLALAIFLMYKWYIYEYRTGRSPLSLFYSPESLAYRETAILSVSTQNTNAIRLAAGKHGDRAAGVYQPFLQPTGRDIFFVMMGFGTLLSLFVFSRVVAPLPDLVAGGNVVHDVRIEARVAALENSAAAGSSASSGSGGRKGSRSGVGGSGGGRGGGWWMGPIRAIRHAVFSFFEMNPSPVTLASEAAPWTERQRSIVSENRLHMAVAVVCVRIVENVLLFGVLPRTHFACRAMGHCPVGPPVWELMRVLYPGGYSRAKRMDGRSMFFFMETDPTSMLWSFAGVIILSVVLLAAQFVMLNRSYLSIMGYIAGEWVLVDDRKTSKKNYIAAVLKRISSSQSSGSEPTVWDPKRKYKKGELVYYPHASDAIYKATSNAPEGRPRDRELYGLNAVLRKELGHPSTSSFLSHLATFQLLVVLSYAALWLLLVVFGYWHQTYGLLWATLAHLVAAQGLLSSARPLSTMKELQQLNAEVIAGN